MELWTLTEIPVYWFNLWLCYYWKYVTEKYGVICMMKVCYWKVWYNLYDKSGKVYELIVYYMIERETENKSQEWKRVTTKWINKIIGITDKNKKRISFNTLCLMDLCYMEYYVCFTELFTFTICLCLSDVVSRTGFLMLYGILSYAYVKAYDMTDVNIWIGYAFHV